MAAPSAWKRLRFAPLLVGGASLLLGFWTGLDRLGLAVAPPLGAELHAPLMICGMLGTLISLERAVAIGRPWTYAAPALSAAGALVLVTGSPRTAAALFLSAGTILVAASAAVTIRLPALFTALLTVAAACWVVGTASWAGGAALPEVAGWWLAFLVLTIAAERLELSRMVAPPGTAQAVFVLAVLVVLGAVALGGFGGRAATAFGLGLLGLTAWLVRYDVARHTVRQPGQARFAATCMLAGYLWLAVAGALLVAIPPDSTAFGYDAAVHAIAVGFVLSMIFGHAPIIFPAITGLRVRAPAAAYGPLALLHLSVLWRVAADLGEWTAWRPTAGVLTVAAFVTYAATLVAGSRRSAAGVTPARGGSASSAGR